MNPPKPNVPVPHIQSLAPTGVTGTVPPPARTASGSIPAYPIEVGEEVVAVEDHMPVMHAPPPKKNIFLQYWRKMGGGSLALSLLIHAGLIALFIAIVTITVREPKVDFLPGGGSKQGAEASQELAHAVQQKKRTSMNKSTPMRKVVSASANAAIALPDLPIDAVDVPDMAIPMGGGLSGSGGFGSSGAGGGFGTGRGIGGQQGFSSLPPSMKSRCSVPERLQKLKESGGSPRCEKAVSSALEYLKTKQNPDGSWGDNYKAAMTGFALLCYLGRCETPDSTFYGDTVMKGIQYLVELSNKNNGKLSTVQSNGAVYEHGIATYALGEMYTLARMGSKSLPGMREAFEKGVKLIITHQLPTGGWGYDKTGNYRLSGKSDPSVTGWQYQALKAAKLTGLQIPKLHESINKVVKYLTEIQTADGGFGHTTRGQAYSQWTMTGVGVLGLQTLGHGQQDKIKKGIKFAYELYQKEKPDWKDADLYTWYYVAQMFFQSGGPEWKYWNETALPEILQHQEPDGRWKAASNKHGSTSGGKDIYSTALCTLMLEVYYRYLKVGDREQTSVFDRK